MAGNTEEERIWSDIRERLTNASEVVKVAETPVCCSSLTWSCVLVCELKDV